MLKSIKAISHTKFENLTYDLMLCLGMRNVIWRSPGPDGGRDIEGIVLREDPTGELFSESWFVECKRYAASISWPIVYEKVAYAESNRADVLLMVTTANITPSCATEISKWNAQRRGLRISRLDGPQLEVKLRSFPLLLAKYQLIKGPAQYPVSFQKIASILAVVCTVAEAELEIAAESVAADAAFELSRFVSSRIAQVEVLGRFDIAAKRKVAVPLWLTGLVELSQNLICFLAYLRYVIRAKGGFKVAVAPTPGMSLCLSVDLGVGDLVIGDDSDLVVVGMWCGVQYRISGDDLILWEEG
ncbi:restriction endonuclease [Pseudoxanthomonas japonensis]|uniref:restriction endonuclease n=1 Tax=Pseudoxanthomonas japonensis TaxID=69284 RepID=UPI001391CDFE